MEGKTLCLPLDIRYLLECTVYLATTAIYIYIYTTLLLYGSFSSPSKAFKILLSLFGVLETTLV